MNSNNLKNKIVKTQFSLTLITNSFLRKDNSIFFKCFVLKIISTLWMTIHNFLRFPTPTICLTYEFLFSTSSVVGPSKLEGPMLILAPLLFFCYLGAPIFRRLNKLCFWKDSLIVNLEKKVQTMSFTPNWNCLKRTN